MGVHMSRREWVDQHQSSPGVVQGGQVHEKDSAEKAKDRHSDTNRAVNIGYKYAKRRQTSKNHNTDSAHSVPS